MIFLCCSGPASCKKLLRADRDDDELVPINDYKAAGEDAWKPKVVFEDGRSYEGQWRGHIRHGLGKEVSKYGDFVYEGTFKNDQYDGEGSMRWSNGARYEGQFRANEKDGLGAETYSTGEVFRGHFKNGVIHGKGEYFFQDRTSIKGVWQEGVLAEELHPS